MQEKDRRSKRRRQKADTGDAPAAAAPKRATSSRSRQQRRTAAPSPQSMRDTLDVCCLCEDGGLLIICDGPCLRSFHIQCLGLESMPDGNRWLCPDCDAKQHICLQCGEVGDDNAEGDTGVFKCTVASCGRFYHRAYVRCCGSLHPSTHPCPWSRHTPATASPSPCLTTRVWIPAAAVACLLLAGVP